MRPLAIALLALLLSAAAPAAAATVVTGAPQDALPGETASIVTIEDAAGVPNVLSVRSAGGEVSVREEGPDVLEARGTCRAVTQRHVVCEAADVEARLGGGDDVAVARGTPYDLLALGIDGGEGDDVLRGPAGGLQLFGGPGDDRLVGGSGPDWLVGGAGNDRLSGGGSLDELVGDGFASAGPAPAGPPEPPTGPAVAPGDDVLDGGPGSRDFATWTERRAPVRVDLASGAAGARGERDRVRGIEDVAGGRGADTLRGTDGGNELLGGPGADRLAGRGGRDVLDAGSALDRSDSGDADHAADRLGCGAGRDRVVDPYLEAMPRSCERMSFNDVDILHASTLIAQPRVLPDGRLLFHTVDCACAGTGYRRVSVRVGGREIGRSGLVRMPDHPRRPYIPVRLRRPLPHRGFVHVVITGFHPIGGEDPNGPAVTERYRFAYRLRR